MCGIRFQPISALRSHGDSYLGNHHTHSPVKTQPCLNLPFIQLPIVPTCTSYLTASFLLGTPDAASATHRATSESETVAFPFFSPMPPGFSGSGAPDVSDNSRCDGFTHVLVPHFLTTYMPRGGSPLRRIQEYLCAVSVYPSELNCPVPLFPFRHPFHSQQPSFFRCTYRAKRSSGYFRALIFRRRSRAGTTTIAFLRTGSPTDWRCRASSPTCSCTPRGCVRCTRPQRRLRGRRPPCR